VFNVNQLLKSVSSQEDLLLKENLCNAKIVVNMGLKNAGMNICKALLVAHGVQNHLIDINN